MATLSPRDASVLRRFEVFCALEGITSPAAWGDEAAVEAFLAIGCSHLAPHSLGTYRSTLARLGGITTSSEFPGSRAAHPYDRVELSALWSIVRHQPSPARIANATVLLGIMVGAGLRPGEVAQLRRADLEWRRGELVVTVRGPDERRVPVLSPYREALRTITASRTDFLFRPGAGRRTTKNLVGETCAALVRDPEDVALHSARARATFICQHLKSETPLAQLCELAGLQSVESLLRYAAFVEGAPATKATLRAKVR